MLFLFYRWEDRNSLSNMFKVRVSGRIRRNVGNLGIVSILLVRENIYNLIFF